MYKHLSTRIYGNIFGVGYSGRLTCWVLYLSSVWACSFLLSFIICPFIPLFLPFSLYQSRGMSPLQEAKAGGKRIRVHARFVGASGVSSLTRVIDASAYPNPTNRAWLCNQKGEKKGARSRITYWLFFSWNDCYLWTWLLKMLVCYLNGSKLSLSYLMIRGCLYFCGFYFFVLIVIHHPTVMSIMLQSGSTGQGSCSANF